MIDDLLRLVVFYLVSYTLQEYISGICVVYSSEK